MPAARGVLLNPPEQRWECPNCSLTDVTHVRVAPGEAVQHFHHCRGLVGVWAPMVAAGMARKVEIRAVERGDYVGKEHVQTDAEGRPVMAVTTTRDDGMDVAVLAPMAVQSRREFADDHA